MANDLCSDNLESKLCADINSAVQEKDRTIDVPLTLIYQQTQERTRGVEYKYHNYAIVISYGFQNDERKHQLYFERKFISF